MAEKQRLAEEAKKQAEEDQRATSPFAALCHMLRDGCMRVYVCVCVCFGLCLSPLVISTRRWRLSGSFESRS